MDGIKDADMILWYAKDAEENGHSDWANWFRLKARKRIEMVESDYRDVMDAIEVNSRVADGDEIAMALKEHLECEIDKLKMKIR